MKKKAEEKTHWEYVLIDKKHPLTWQVRQPVLVDYEGKGLRKIVYVAGSNSILQSQNEGLKKTVVEFINGKLRFPKTDTLLKKFIDYHSELDVKFKLLDPEAEAQAKLSLLELQEEAKDLIRNSDPEMLRAVAVILFDKEAYSFGDKVVKLKCFGYADKEPKKMLDLLNDPKTKVRYLVALAFLKGVLKTNVQKTAVQWTDNGEIVIPLAVGETAVEKMADFLYDDKNATTLQELSKRVESLAEVA